MRIIIYKSQAVWAMQPGGRFDGTRNIYEYNVAEIPFANNTRSLRLCTKAERSYCLVVAILPNQIIIIIIIIIIVENNVETCVQIYSRIYVKRIYSI